MTGGAFWTARLLQFVCALVIFGVALRLPRTTRASGVSSPPSRLPESTPVAGKAASAPGTTANPAPRFTLARGLLPSLAAIGALSTLAGLSCEAAIITGSWNAVADVVTGTRIGQALVLRILLFAAVPVLPRLLPQRARRIGLCLLGGVLTASFAWTGHGSAGDASLGPMHQAADVLHLLAAGVWIGALVDLCAQAMHSLRTSHAASARALLMSLAGFSATGPAIVAVLTLTGIINSWILIAPGNATTLFTTPYGLVLLGKLGLFAVMLALAALHRLRLTPRLQAALDPEAARSGAATSETLKALRRSLLAETILSLLVLAAVAWLGMLEPPADGV